MTIEAHDQHQQTTQREMWTNQQRPEITLSFEQTYRAYQPVLGSYLLQSTESRELAEDLLQDTFLKAWQVWSTVRELQHLKAWLYRVAKNRNIDDYRKRTLSGRITVRSLQDVQEDLSNETALSSQEESYPTQELVRATLARMKPQARQILLMALYEEKSYQEISKLLNLSLPAVRMRVHRARESFRTLFRELDQPGTSYKERETQPNTSSEEE